MQRNQRNSKFADLPSNMCLLNQCRTVLEVSLVCVQRGVTPRTTVVPLLSRHTMIFVVLLAVFQSMTHPIVD